MTDRALILVDLQNDFMPGGALAVRDGDRVVPIANRLAQKFEMTVATQDWHPANHGSFASVHEGRQPGEVIDLNGLPQVLWPPHCVQATKGAEFHPDLDIGAITKVFRKGTDAEIDSYSGFFDNGHRKSTGMGEWLREQKVERVWIAGLATDYCVRYTALDARQLGFETSLVVDACRGVNLQEGDVERAIEEMRTAGVRIVRSEEL